MDHDEVGGTECVLLRPARLVRQHGGRVRGESVELSAVHSGNGLRGYRGGVWVGEFGGSVRLIATDVCSASSRFSDVLVGISAVLTVQQLAL